MLSPILEGAGEEGLEGSAAPGRKTRGRITKAPVSTGKSISGDQESDDRCADVPECLIQEHLAP